MGGGIRTHDLRSMQTDALATELHPQLWSCGQTWPHWILPPDNNSMPIIGQDHITKMYKRQLANFISYNIQHMECPT